MDDSVIKVLRRNGSWNKGKNKAVANEQMKEALKNRNEEFSLDENFGILAEEIKKRMKNPKIYCLNIASKLIPTKSMYRKKKR